jgi:hypothetical protein
MVATGVRILYAARRLWSWLGIQWLCTLLRIDFARDKKGLLRLVGRKMKQTHFLPSLTLFVM